MQLSHAGTIICALVLSTCSLMLTAPCQAAGVPAFPGAEGFGSATPGGRGGRVVRVTNLDDYIPGEQAPLAGSLRAACAATGPRIVVFAVSGTITLKTTLIISEPWLTLAGQSAPGGGVCLKNHGLSIQTHDVVLRHIRVRPGDELGAALKQQGKGFAPDGISIGTPSRNVVVDHCSVSWAIDECLSVSGADITDITVQWCLISESLNDSFHEKGPHGFGSLLRANGKLSFHHNLYAHHSNRSPRPGTYGEGSLLLDFRNNVIHDSTGYTAADPARINYVGNFIRRPRKHVFSIGGEATQMFVAGNHLDGGGERNDDQWSLITAAKAVNRMTEPYDVAAITTDSASEALAGVIATCGASRPRRDAVDVRVIRQLESGTGGLIDSQTQVGGWPTLAAAAPPADADQDGMPDDWERAHGLDPADAGDASADRNGDGYTNIEEYLDNIE